MQKKVIPVQWMHCRSCEVTLEKTIWKLQNVSKVTANYSKWNVEIEYNWEIDNKSIETIINQNWYKIWEKQTLPWLQKDVLVYYEIFIVAFLLLIGYHILQSKWIDFSSTNVVWSPTLGVVLLIWLTAGFSSCMALVGGLVLAVSAKLNQNSNMSAWRKFYPHIYFNVWRIAGFWIFGAILWILGSVLSMSVSVLAIFTLIVWAIMFLLWVNLTEISPKLASISITLPKFLSKNIWEDSVSDPRLWAMITWALTFFLPCWFTLAMQVYAMSSGSAMMGGMVMATFALWTAPWLIGVWWFTSIFKWSFAKRFFRYVWVLVILLWLFNVINSWNLLKASVFANKINISNIDTSKLEVQEVRIKQLASGYEPRVVSIEPWKKIRLIVESQNNYSCSSRFVIPSVWVNKQLEKWENVIEFVSPNTVGQEIPFSCIMWMYTGKFKVVEPSEKTNSKSFDWTSTNQNWSNNNQSEPWLNINENPLKVEQSSTKQVNTDNFENSSSNNIDQSWIETISMEYTSNWLTPSNLNLKSWKTYKIVINSKTTVGGCMSTILIPWLDENVQYVRNGAQIVFDISPKSSWQYPFTCAMWVPHWYISVE